MFPRFLLVFVFCSAAAAGAFAQDPTPSPTPIDTDREGRAAEDLKNVPTVAPGYESDERLLPDLGRIGVDMSDQRPISVREAIALALENNTDIEVTRKNVRIAEYDLQAARGVYQPRLIGQTSYERATTPNVSIFSSNQKTTQGAFVGNAAVTGFIPRLGTVITGEVMNQRVTTNNPIAILSPQYNSGFSLRLTQPLLRGRGFDQNRRTIEIAKRNLALTDVQFRQRSIEIITGVQRAYWDLTYALRNLQVQRDGVRDAKQQLEHNRRLVEEGQLAPIDIVAAETQVATFEQAVYEALNAVTQAENGLKNLIAPNRHDDIWNESITPTDQVELTVPRTTLADAITTAMANRPELELSNVRKEINEIDRRYYRNQTLPQVDLIARYGSAGIGGSQNPNFSSPFDIPCNPDDPGYEACIARQAAQQAQLQNLLQSIGGPGSPSETFLRINIRPIAWGFSSICRSLETRPQRRNSAALWLRANASRPSARPPSRRYRLKCATRYRPSGRPRPAFVRLPSPARTPRDNTNQSRESSTRGIRISTGCSNARPR
jgi:outer membrane protein TolC